MLASRRSAHLTETGSQGLIQERGVQHPRDPRHEFKGVSAQTQTRGDLEHGGVISGI